MKLHELSPNLPDVPSLAARICQPVSERRGAILASRTGLWTGSVPSAHQNGEYALRLEQIESFPARTILGKPSTRNVPPVVTIARVIHKVVRTNPVSSQSETVSPEQLHAVYHDDEFVGGSIGLTTIPAANVAHALPSFVNHAIDDPEQIERIGLSISALACTAFGQSNGFRFSTIAALEQAA